MKYLIIVMILFQSCFANKLIKITEFSTYTYNKLIDTVISLGKEQVYYNNFFLISNFRDQKQTTIRIDSFVVNYISKNNYSPNTKEIRLYFYKETGKTNLESIKRNPKVVDRYSNEHDIVFYYAIKLNGNNVREKYKKGKVIETTQNLPPMPKFIIIRRENGD